MNLCTYFDSHYAPQGLALLRSVQRHESSAHIYVLALDMVAAEMVLAADWLVEVAVVRLVDIETEALLALKAQRSWREYIFTLTAPWIAYCLTRFQLESVAYLDADCWLVDSLSALYSEVGSASVAVIPHRWSPQHAARLRVNGEYNVGWVYFRNDEHARTALGLWQDDCYRWRREQQRERNAVFSDQVYLNSWPALLGGRCHIVKHLGANLAPWSQEQYRYAWRFNQLLLTDHEHRPLSPVLFYHFHGWKSPAQRAGYPLADAVVDYLYLPYEQDVLSQGASMQGGYDVASVRHAVAV